jgi:NTP pyrophosphatase (non-canonical NTP hydrolase)
MNLDTYQNEAMRTAIYPLDRALEYTVLGLVSEAGEVAGKVKKIIRDRGGKLTVEDRQDLAAELGDTLWYVAEASRALGYSLNTVAQINLDKLHDRARRNKIHGEGDYR